MTDLPCDVEPQSVPVRAGLCTWLDKAVVVRPTNLPQQPAEGYSILDGLTYWTANAHVGNAIGEIENPWLRAWVCRVLNADVLAGGAP